MNGSVHYTDEEYEQITLYVQELIDRFDEHPDKDVRDDVFELLQGFDALHREALARFLRLVDAEAPELTEKIESDFALRTLLELYDLLPAEAGGTPASRPDGFVAFEDVDVLPDEGRSDGIGGAERPVWIPGGHRNDLEPGGLTSLEIEGTRVLLCRVGDDIYALQNACLGSILPLDQGQLNGHMLVCPWHGCHYDVRTGELEENPDRKLETFPVEMDDEGHFSIGFNIRH